MDQVVNTFKFFISCFFSVLSLFNLIVRGFVQFTDSVFPLLLILTFIFVDSKCKLFHTACPVSASVYSKIHIERTPVFSYRPQMDAKNVVILTEHIPRLMLRKIDITSCAGNVHLLPPHI